MYYHASQTAGIETLEPRVSNHGTPMVYFSPRRENVLPYLSNAIEKYCRETGFSHSGAWQKWASYGFTRDGRLRMEEYYPNALADTYRGVAGYVYAVEPAPQIRPLDGIPGAFAAQAPVKVSGCTFIADAYEEILCAAARGQIVLLRYEDSSAAQLEWIHETMLHEYQSCRSADYRHFLRGKFPFVCE